MSPWARAGGLMAALVGLLAAGGEVPAQKEAPPLVLVSTTYPLPPLSTAKNGHGPHSVSLAVRLKAEGGEGSLSFDPNLFTFNDFGDRASSTLIAPRAVPVKLTRVAAADPSGQGRRLYSLGAEKLGAEMRLVVPTRAGGDYRLLVKQPGDKGWRVVIHLRPAPAAKKGVKGI